MSSLAKDLKRSQHAKFGKILGHNDIHEDSDSTFIWPWQLKLGQRISKTKFHGSESPRSRAGGKLHTLGLPTNILTSDGEALSQEKPIWIAWQKPWWVLWLQNKRGSKHFCWSPVRAAHGEGRCLKGGQQDHSAMDHWTMELKVLPTQPQAVSSWQDRDRQGAEGFCFFSLLEWAIMSSSDEQRTTRDLLSPTHGCWERGCSQPGCWWCISVLHPPLQDCWQPDLAPPCWHRCFSGLRDWESPGFKAAETLSCAVEAAHKAFLQLFICLDWSALCDSMALQAFTGFTFCCRNSHITYDTLGKQIPMESFSMKEKVKNYYSKSHNVYVVIFLLVCLSLKVSYLIFLKSWNKKIKTYALLLCTT